jgi:hypothetical protein
MQLVMGSIVVESKDVFDVKVSSTGFFNPASIFAGKVENASEFSYPDGEGGYKTRDLWVLNIVLVNGRVVKPVATYSKELTIDVMRELASTLCTPDLCYQDIRMEDVWNRVWKQTRGDERE